MGDVPVQANLREVQPPQDSRQDVWPGRKPVQPVYARKKHLLALLTYDQHTVGVAGAGGGVYDEEFSSQIRRDLQARDRVREMVEDTAKERDVKRRKAELRQLVKVAHPELNPTCRPGAVLRQKACLLNPVLAHVGAETLASPKLLGNKEVRPAIAGAIEHTAPRHAFGINPP